MSVVVAACFIIILIFVALVVYCCNDQSRRARKRKNRRNSRQTSQHNRGMNMHERPVLNRSNGVTEFIPNNQSQRQASNEERLPLFHGDNNTTTAGSTYERPSTFGPALQRQASRSKNNMPQQSNRTDHRDSESERETTVALWNDSCVNFTTKPIKVPYQLYTHLIRPTLQLLIHQYALPSNLAAFVLKKTVMFDLNYFYWNLDKHQTSKTVVLTWYSKKSQYSKQKTK